MLVAGEALSRYGFGDGHPFGPDRQDAFLREMRRSPAYAELRVAEPRMAERAELESFHRREYVDLVVQKSREGRGYLDAGDTPASKGIYEASSLVVGGTLLARRGDRRGQRRDARSFRSAGCITPRARMPPVSACSTTAASRSNCCGAGTASGASPTSTSTRTTATACSTRSNRTRTCCSRTSTRTGATCIRARARPRRPARAQRTAPS